MKTALLTAAGMNLPDYARAALRSDAHPQERTRAFHQMFGAPIRDEAPDATFSHMDDQRVAFRLSFILSEALEILEKGLGLKVRMGFKTNNDLVYKEFVDGSDNAKLCAALLDAITRSGKRDLIEVVDGLGDLNVVTNGFAVELGVDMLAADQEVYASNLTKADENGQPIVADGSDPKYPAGKILKGPNFIEPQLGVLLGLEPEGAAQAA
jgi:predicted HAD superfamily Cof-like phosphohydrolase